MEKGCVIRQEKERGLTLLAAPVGEGELEQKNETRHRREKKKIATAGGGGACGHGENTNRKGERMEVYTRGLVEYGSYSNRKEQKRPTFACRKRKKRGEGGREGRSHLSKNAGFGRIQERKIIDEREVEKKPATQPSEGRGEEGNPSCGREGLQP